MLAEHGLVISAGKMSGLWSGQLVSIKLCDLNVICVVLGCGVDELLIPEPDKVARPGTDQPHEQTGTGQETIAPRPWTGRSVPPV